ncbi:hypothetical protein [Mesorhizobium sp. M4A.F.Ca.ET.050.02.1.1]|uniref:hypothetical protein n=1 Tax=Mesorhizobium sp. M4A.F.Ca.ET.050.02.1.1 TaxID=2496754 RepID=UPI00167D8759|nr:hypothetical protein [Mesorhizobium sp. M4A.F.Ca.ET.050.02.1.1]
MARNERRCLRPHRLRRRDFAQISLGREIEYLARSVVDSVYRLYSADDLFGPAWVRRELVTDAPVVAGPVYRLRGRLARGIRTDLAPAAMLQFVAYQKPNGQTVVRQTSTCPSPQKTGLRATRNRQS